MLVRYVTVPLTSVRVVLHVVIKNGLQIQKYQETGSIARRPGSGLHYKIMAALVEQKMRKDDETVAVQLHCTCICRAERTRVQHFPAYNSSLLDIARVELSRQ